MKPHNDLNKKSHYMHLSEKKSKTGGTRGLLFFGHYIYWSAP